MYPVLICIDPVDNVLICDAWIYSGFFRGSMSRLSAKMEVKTRIHGSDCCHLPRLEFTTTFRENSELLAWKRMRYYRSKVFSGILLGSCFKIEQTNQCL